MHLPSLLALFKRAIRKKDVVKQDVVKQDVVKQDVVKQDVVKQNVVKQDCLLLNLPVDLIYNILDELQWPEKILLSQTCQLLWYTLHQKYSSAMRRATIYERLEYLTVLGKILPDHRLCTSCRALHLLDYRDLPTMRPGSFKNPCPVPDSLESRHYLHPYYSIAFHHVQLAIKYTRHRNFHQEHRAKLLQSFEITFPRLYSMGLMFSATPVIVCGRFILMTAFYFYDAEEPIPISTISDAPLQICPHLRSGLFLSPNFLLEAIRLARKEGQRG